MPVPNLQANAIPRYLSDLARAIGFLLAAVALGSLGISTTVAAAPFSKEQQQQIDKIEEAGRELTKLLRSRDDEKAAKLLVETEAQLTALLSEDAPPELRRRVAPLVRRLKSTRQQLERRGVEMPSPGGADADAFRAEVAPLLVTKCGGCHIDRASGGLSMATYGSLMRGSDSGPVVHPGNSAASTLMVLVEAGEMPRGQQKLSAEEIGLLKKWIESGATVADADRAAPLAQLANTGSMSTTAQIPISKPTGDETVHFSRDLAPVFIEHCIECHGGDRPAAQLGLDRMTSLLRGGRSGPIVVPQDPDESLLIKKLEGNAGAQMPLRRSPLPEEVIAKVRTWIAEGATFDGSDPTQSFEQMMRIAQASQLSDVELADRRVALGLENWQLANPEEEPRRLETDGFLLLGNIPADQLETIAQVASEQVDTLRRQLHLPDDAPLIKGRLTLFVFRHVFDYTEFGRMVEGREVGDSPSGHWRYNVLEAYACLLVPREVNDDTLEPLLAELLAGVYMQSLGDVPPWFSQGVAKTIRSRVAPRDEKVRQWENRLDELLAQKITPEEVLTGEFVSDDVGIERFGLVQFLMSNAARYTKLLGALQEGMAFDAALREAYGGNAEYVAGVWLRNVGRGR